MAGCFLLQILLTYISAILNCCSAVKGKKGKRNSKLGKSNLVKDLEKETKRRRSRIFCWLVYDLIAIAVVCGIVILSIVNESKYGSNQLQNITSTNVLFTPEQHIPRDLAEVLYWCRVLYGWFCFPWILLLLPGMFPLLTHTKETGYTRYGKTVPMASSLIRLLNFQHQQDLRDQKYDGLYQDGDSSGNSSGMEMQNGKNPMKILNGEQNESQKKMENNGAGHQKKKKSSNNPFSKR